MSENVNAIFRIIKDATDIKSIKSESIKRFGFFNNKALVNIQKIINSKEIKFVDYKLFFENFIKFLQKEFLDKKPVKQSHPEETFKDFILSSNDTTFKLEGLSEEAILKKNENAVFLKILTILTDSSFETLTISKVSQIFITLKFFFNKKIDFLLVDVSTYLNAIYYSLIQTIPFEAANMLAKLVQVGLLNEANLESLQANFKLDITLLAHVINKLSLNEGTDSLLTQTNLDKLLEILKNSELTLKFIAKFIQVDDESKALTQERFDLAIILNKLLTHENINKIEKAEFDSKELIDVLVLLNTANILNQDNFDNIIRLERKDYSDLFSVLSKFSDANILDQEQFSQFLSIYRKAKVFDNQNKMPSNSKENSSDSLTDRLFTAFMKVKVLTKNICNRIVEFFMKKINLHQEKQQEKAEVINNYENRNRNTFFDTRRKDDRLTRRDSLTNSR